MFKIVSLPYRKQLEEPSESFMIPADVGYKANFPESIEKLLGISKC